MKVKFGEDLTRCDSGKHKFLARLADAFRAKGIRIVYRDNADVFLHICRNFEDGKKCEVKIARVDGLILNKKQGYAKQNKKLKRAIKKSDGVIYQGSFCKEAYERFLRINKTSASILNGASSSDFLPRNPENFFLACCKWRPHKRLNTICESYLVGMEKGLDADLVVVGKPPECLNHPRIKYLGWVGSNQLAELLSKAIATVHLSWLDWCPNSMVESAIAGCPIIYTNSGGSGEVGKNAGLEVNDTQWNFKPVDLYNPPPVDIDQVSSHMITLKKNSYYVSKPELDIQYVADRYIEFFNKVLNEKN